LPRMRIVAAVLPGPLGVPATKLPCHCANPSCTRLYSSAEKEPGISCAISQAHCARNSSNSIAARICGLPNLSWVKNLLMTKTDCFTMSDRLRRIAHGWASRKRAFASRSAWVRGGFHYRFSLHRTFRSACRMAPGDLHRFLLLPCICDLLFDRAAPHPPSRQRAAAIVSFADRRFRGIRRGGGSSPGAVAIGAAAFWRLRTAAVAGFPQKLLDRYTLGNSFTHNIARGNARNSCFLLW